MTEYVLIRSWHLASGIVSRGGMIFTLCGRWAAKDAKTAPELPLGKSCESCYRNREVDISRALEAALSKYNDLVRYGATLPDEGLTAALDEVRRVIIAEARVNVRVNVRGHTPAEPLLMYSGQTTRGRAY